MIRFNAHHLFLNCFFFPTSELMDVFQMFVAVALCDRGLARGLCTQSSLATLMSTGMVHLKNKLIAYKRDSALSTSIIC